MSRGQFLKFYTSNAWTQCRDGYMRKVGGLCEVCKEKGIITPAEIVHHKIHLSEENINDPEITLSYDNLLAVCRKHHGELHGTPRRYSIGEDGTVFINS